MKIAAAASPMTVGNMRANGVRTLAVYCLGRGRGYSAVLDVSTYPMMFRCPRSVQGYAASAAGTWARQPAPPSPKLDRLMRSKTCHHLALSDGRPCVDWHRAATLIVRMNEVPARATLANSG
jgi:hypothetical protein